MGGSDKLQKKKISFLPIVFMMFMFISAGGYGLEDAIGSAGPGIVFAMLLILPIVWAIPYGLICSELGAKYPGSAYHWAKKALGPFWGYVVAWAKAVSCFVDPAIYLVMSVEYMSSVFGITLTPMTKWAICIGLAVMFCFLNLRGVSLMALTSTFASIIVVLPFILLVAFSIPQIHHNPFEPFLASGSGVNALLGDANTALMICMWLFAGYEALHSFSDEVENSEKLIPKAFLYALPLAVLVYIVPTFTGLAAVGSWESWSSAGPLDYVAVGKAVGGNFLMILFAISAIIANLGLYGNYTAFGSRMLYELAEDGVFFKGLDKLGKHGTPYITIIIFTVVTALLSYGSFADLVIIDMVIILVPIIIYMISAIKLRRMDADKEWDCFRIKCNNTLFTIIACFPIVIATYAICTAGLPSILAGVGALAAGTPIFFYFNHKKKAAEKLK